MKNKDQPVNPVTIQKEKGDDTVIVTYPGLTKREYFAAMAMQGLLANKFTSVWEIEKVCLHSIMYADELLKQLEK